MGKGIQVATKGILSVISQLELKKKLIQICEIFLTFVNGFLLNEKDRITMVIRSFLYSFQVNIMPFGHRPTFFLLS